MIRSQRFCPWATLTKIKPQNLRKSFSSNAFESLYFCKIAETKSQRIKSQVYRTKKDEICLIVGKVGNCDRKSQVNAKLIL